MNEAVAFSGFVDNVINIFRPLSVLLLGLAFCYFIYGVGQVILNSGSEEKLKDGKSAMLWGIIAIFIMLAMWGLATAISSSFGLNESNKPTVDYVAP